jgi:hypothetical protein
LRDSFHNERLEESSKSRQRNLTLNLALRTKTGHGGEIGEANVTIGVWRMVYMRVLEWMRVDMKVRMGGRVRVRMRMRMRIWVSLAV